MKILFVSNLYPPNVVGGYERLCFDVASAMPERGHQVSVLTSGYGKKVEDYPGQTVDRSLRLLVDDNDIYRPFSVSDDEAQKISEYNNSLARQKISAEKPDLIFVWNLFFLNSSFIEALTGSGTRTVFLLTDNWLVSFLNSAFWSRYFTENVLSKPNLSQRIKAGIRSIALAGSRDVFRLDGKAVFPSTFMKNLYKSAGFAFKDETIIPHGVKLPAKTVQEHATRSSMVRSGELNLLFAGRIVQIKGAHTLIEALPEIIRSLPDLSVILTVVGDSSDAAYLKRIKTMVSQKGLEKHVVFTAPVKEDNLFELFQNYDIYVFPSLYEPFSLTLIHALHAGIPTIASDTGGNSEIVKNRENGLLFRSEDPVQLASLVLKLAENAPLRKNISHTARKVEDYYTFNRMVGQIDNYLRAKP